MTCSTITYNTRTFLKFKLNELINSNTIDFYAFIQHKKEADELKDHTHLLIIPSKQIDTKTIDAELCENVKGSDKPLGTCSIWHTVGKNNISDWILYGKHDPVYCKLKGYLDRVYTYTDDDFVTSSRDGLDGLIFEAYHSSKFYFEKQIRDRIQKSLNPYATGVELVKNGYIPLQSACSFHHFLQMTT